MFKKILCPVDGSDHSRKALELAVHLATSSDAKLVLLHALLTHANAAELKHFAEVEGLARKVQPEVKRLMSMEGRLEYHADDQPVAIGTLTEVGQHILDEAKTDAQTAGVADVSTVLTGGDVADQILRCIDKQDIDCVVMGARGLGDIKALFLGSVSNKVANQAPCTCITVK